MDVIDRSRKRQAVAYELRAEEADDEGTAGLEAVGQPAEADGREACADVGWDGGAVGLLAAAVKVFDNGGSYRMSVIRTRRWRCAKAYTQADMP